MNPLFSILALIIAIVLIVKQIKTWHYRVLLSPGFYFGIIWSIGFFGVTVLHYGGLLVETYPYYIDELNIFAGFTCLCFLFWTKKGRKEVNEEIINVYFPKDSFTIFAVLAFVAASIEFLRSGAGVQSMGQARDLSHEIIAGRSTLVSYATLFGKGLSILAGYKLVERLLTRNKFVFSNILLYIFPLISNLLLSIVIGGRVDFVYSMLYYFIGAAFYLPIHLKLNSRLLTISIISILIVVWFINAVQNERSVYHGGQTSTTEQYLRQKSPILGALYGPIFYMSASYIGYQYRRVDDVDLDHLGYGMYTFNGFINWTIPFGNQIGLGDFSIAKALGIYYNNQHTYDYERDYYQSTHSGYIPIVKDFGLYGSFICIFFLTYISHSLFVRIQKKRCINRMYKLYFFLLFLDYWIYMNYYGTLSSTVLIPLYPLLLIDFTDSIIRGSKK